MMNRKPLLAIGIALLSLAFFAASVNAQEPRPTPTNVPSSVPETAGPADDGSIRGTIYEDLNGDGKCGPGDPILAWIPIQFVSDDGGRTTAYLQSGDNGTYGLVAAGYGDWNVSADPPAPWVVTSAKTVKVSLSREQNLALNVDFCLANIETVQRRVTLPQAGAPLASMAVALFAVLGMAFMGLGLGWRRFVENRSDNVNEDGRLPKRPSGQRLTRRAAAQSPEADSSDLAPGANPPTDGESARQRPCPAHQPGRPK
jgi:hypothetical protein